MLSMKKQNFLEGIWKWMGHFWKESPILVGCNTEVKMYLKMLFWALSLILVALSWLTNIFELLFCLLFTVVSCILLYFCSLATVLVLLVCLTSFVCYSCLLVALPDVCQLPVWCLCARLHGICVMRVVTCYTCCDYISSSLFCYFSHLFLQEAMPVARLPIHIRNCS